MHGRGHGRRTNGGFCFAFAYPAQKPQKAGVALCRFKNLRERNVMETEKPAFDPFAVFAGILFWCAASLHAQNASMVTRSKSANQFPKNP
jgi:hypothetical protein